MAPAAERSDAMWQGRVVSLHIAPEASAKMETVGRARAVPGRGLEGDRYFTGTGYYSARPGAGGRELTLIEVESVAALAAEGVPPERPGIELAVAVTRRNIATAG